MHWAWKNGRPYLSPIHSTDQDLQLSTQGNNETSTIIRRLPLNKANRILGVYLSPDENFTTQLQILKKKADAFAYTLRSPA